MAINCNACEELRENAPDFVVNELTDRMCTSLKNNTGLNPSNSNTNCDDLHDANDCLVGRMAQDVEAYEVCDWKEYMKKFVTNLYNVLKAIICWLCGIQDSIEDLFNNVRNLINKVNQILEGLGGLDFITVVRKYRYTVPASKFIKTHGDPPEEMSINGTPGSVTQWFSGAPGVDECYISIPVSEMDEVVGVWAQTMVVVDKECMQTVNVQTYRRDGDNLIVNFDTYELTWNSDQAPYDVVVEFLVIGKKNLE